jgi:hypothetical protein
MRTSILVKNGTPHSPPRRVVVTGSDGDSSPAKIRRTCCPVNSLTVAVSDACMLHPGMLKRSCSHRLP